MKKNYFLLIGIFIFFGFTFSQAQVISAGFKYDKKGMFQATVNYPTLFDKNKPFDIYFGLDYTTKNDEIPSGLAPQLGLAYYIVDNDYKDYLLSANLNAGYLFDFNKEFDNQFRISPHIYFELLSLLNLKVGYEYMMPLGKGYPFVSIGIGGGFMFRHFKMM
ncbi:hypothetical protein [Moheibacter sp.]|uniref:hypothetical protein n=1 Tax=Moheibacter sp. TaxID=1965316 RepID=UPI003C758582